VAGQALKLTRATDMAKQLNIPFIVIFNKVDINSAKKNDLDYCKNANINFIQISSKNKLNINELKEFIIKIIPPELKEDPLLIGDIINKSDNVILVVPIDLSAPKGRIILPQVMTIREILDVGANAIVIKEDQIIQTLSNLKNPPRLVITDSQAIEKVAKDVPMNIPLTTFSTVFARFKGDFNVLLKGAAAIENLKDNDKILIAEACSHHVKEDDIGRFKIPNWIKKYTGKKLIFDVVAGGDFPENLEEYALVISCGACMLNRCEMMRRITECVRRGIPVSNYGIVISKAHGTLERTAKPFL
jgi:[FeFe] hydrogenase H-cluster maturation GTPase HydF